MAAVNVRLPDRSALLLLFSSFHVCSSGFHVSAAYRIACGVCRSTLPAGKKRKLDVVSSDPAVETDEQLARRLHEELNALTRHSRRGPAPAPVLSTQRSTSSKVSKPAAAATGSKAAALKGKQQQQQLQQQQKQQLQGSNAEQVEDAQEEGAVGKGDKPRKRSMLNRELAMLVVDMVETHVKPVTGPRSKSKDEHDQHDQQQQDEHHSAGAKHESSSSLSEQERLAIEHLHAAGVEAKPVNKLLEAAHLTARVSLVSRVAVCAACSVGCAANPLLSLPLV
jgi:hypothetical protein